GNRPLLPDPPALHSPHRSREHAHRAVRAGAAALGVLAPAAPGRSRRGGAARPGPVRVPGRRRPARLDPPRGRAQGPRRGAVLRAPAERAAVGRADQRRQRRRQVRRDGHADARREGERRDGRVRRARHGRGGALRRPGAGLRRGDHPGRRPAGGGLRRPGGARPRAVRGGLMLQVDQGTVRISGFTVLRALSLEVASGSIVGLIGRNGAGKTTTLRTIMGLLPLEAGDVRLDGRSLRSLPAHERAAQGIGYMPEDRRLIAALTAEENVLVPTWARRIPNTQERLATIYRLMPEVRDLAGRHGSQLSGGQQKLVALARCFMSGSRVLLLDEPFEGVAPALSHRLVTAVKE